MSSKQADVLAPEAEERRIAALEGFSILDTLPEQGFEDVTALASFVCGTPISTVSLVGADRQWFKSVRGLVGRETPRSQSFCAHTIETGAMLVVRDAREDSRFRTNPLVTGEPGIRFYAGAPLKDADGHVLGTVCVIDTVPRELAPRQVMALEALARQVMSLMEQRRTIAAQEKAAEELEQTAARLRLAADAAELGMFSWEAAGDRVLWENDRMYRITGRTREQGPVNVAQFVTELVHPDHAASFAAAIDRTIATGERLWWQGMFRRGDGTLGWVEFTGQLERSADGAPLRLLGTALDITARVETEEALRQSEKLAAVGRLASTIAHEMNNPLESVMNLVYLAAGSEGLPPRAQGYLDTAERELRRVSAITSQTLRFHRQATRPRAVTAEELFQDVLSIYQGRLVNTRTAVDVRLRSAEPVLCFDGEIRQVLNNLVGNAIDAMPNCGRLLLRGRRATDWATGRKGMRLTVADAGSGMTAATRKRLFDAFFTTKGTNGTGLGLWVSQEIVERHKGSLGVRSREDGIWKGTVFALFLPFEAVNR